MIRRSILGIGLGLGLAAPAVAEPAMTGAPVTMRSAPTGKAHVVQRIPANAEIDLVNCSRGWCYSSWRNLFGYIPADVIVAGPPPGGAGPPVAVAPPSVVVAPPVVVAPAWGWGGPYIGGGWGYGWRRW